MTLARAAHSVMEAVLQQRSNVDGTVSADAAPIVEFGVLPVAGALASVVVDACSWCLRFPKEDASNPGGWCGQDLHLHGR